jgi:hypothetical protein
VLRELGHDGCVGVFCVVIAGEFTWWECLNRNAFGIEVSHVGGAKKLPVIIAEDCDKLKTMNDLICFAYFTILLPRAALLSGVKTQRRRERPSVIIMKYFSPPVPGVAIGPTKST